MNFLFFQLFSLNIILTSSHAGNGKWFSYVVKGQSSFYLFAIFLHHPYVLLFFLSIFSLLHLYTFLINYYSLLHKKRIVFKNLRRLLTQLVSFITKYLFFYKRNKQDDIPLLLPKLKINNYEIKWAELVKFVGVLLDENSLHIKYIKNKIAKSVGL